jgi:hypothetical protein
LPALSVRVVAGVQQSATLSELMVLLKQSRDLSAIGVGGSAGWLGALMLLAWLAPLLPHLPVAALQRQRRLHLLGAVPLLFMLGIALMLWWTLRRGMGQAREVALGWAGPQGAAMAEQMAEQMASAIWQALSLGIGSYLGVAAAAYLAWRGWRAWASPAPR